MPQDAHSCPRCGSASTQSIAVLVAAGTSRGEFSGESVSFSANSGWSAGTNSGTVHSQSALAVRFSPKPPSDDVGLLAMSITLFVVGALAFFASSVVGAVLVTAGAVSAGIYQARGKLRQEFRRAFEMRKSYLRRAWFCHRCGQDFLPVVQPASSEVA